MGHDPIFHLRSASVRFEGCTALRDLDLDVAPGETVAVIGPSGAGKSSLIGLLNGTVVATAGDVRVLGCDYSLATCAPPNARSAPSTSISIWSSNCVRCTT